MPGTYARAFFWDEKRTIRNFGPVGRKTPRAEPIVEKQGRESLPAFCNRARARARNYCCDRSPLITALSSVRLGPALLIGRIRPIGPIRGATHTPSSTSTSTRTSPSTRTIQNATNHFSPQRLLSLTRNGTRKSHLDPGVKLHRDTT